MNLVREELPGPRVAGDTAAVEQVLKLMTAAVAADELVGALARDDTG